MIPPNSSFAFTVQRGVFVLPNRGHCSKPRRHMRLQMFFNSMAGVIGGNDNSQRLSADFTNETVDKLKSLETAVA
jgi:hypothetical protein